MSRRGVAALALGVLAIAVALALLAGRSVPTTFRHVPAIDSGSGLVTPDALACLRSIPIYRSILTPDVVRSASLEGTALRVDVDLDALLRPRLARAGLEGLLDLLPRTARGTLIVEKQRNGAVVLGGETWLLDGPAPLLDALDRNAVSAESSPVWEAIPATPSAIAGARIVPARIAEAEFGGAALATWRQRVEIAERVLGRPLRAEIAEDLAGPVIFALYDGAAGRASSGVLVVGLRRSDRLRTLLDTVFALGALTERATVHRYRDVATGSFRAGPFGPGVAMAVDGPVLLAASSRYWLEAAIDARRGERRAERWLDAVPAKNASWTALSASSFVAHGWARLARAADEPGAVPVHDAHVVPEGATGWRLEGHGPAPAISADPIIPFLRVVLAGGQRGSD